MKLYKRGRVYWFELVFEGRRYRKTTKVANKVKAEGIAAAFRMALAERRVGIVGRKPAPLFSEAMKAFLLWSKKEHAEHPGTYLRYRTSSKPLLAFPKFRGKAIDEITPASIEAYKVRRAAQKGKRTQRPIRPATINRELACLKAAFNHALKDRHDFRNPVSDVEFLAENNEQTRVLMFGEQRQYLGAASETLKDVARLILETGMRPEEVYRLEVGNVHLEHGYLFVPFGKTRAARRRIPLTSTAVSVLAGRMKKAKGECLFPHRKDRDRPMLKVNNAHQRALDKSGVVYFRLYDLRHTWATRAAEGGMDMATLAALLGHSKLNMVMRYAHPQENHKKEAVHRLESVNAAREIEEVERTKALHTVKPTEGSVPENLLV